MLGVLVWIVVILLICFSVTGWQWIIFYVVILPFSTLLFFFYVDFPENHFNIKRFKNDIKYNPLPPSNTKADQKNHYYPN